MAKLLTAATDFIPQDTSEHLRRYLRDSLNLKACEFRGGVSEIYQTLGLLSFSDAESPPRCS